MIDPREWRKIPLEDRLGSLADHSEDTLLRETLTEAIWFLSDSGRRITKLQAHIADLQAEVSRLERLATTITPY